MNKKLSTIIIVTILTFLGAVFCSTLMTMPQVYAASVPCESTKTHEHHHEPAHTHDHEQLGSYDLQKQDITFSCMQNNMQLWDSNSTSHVQVHGLELMQQFTYKIPKASNIQQITMRKKE